MTHKITNKFLQAYLQQRNFNRTIFEKKPPYDMEAVCTEDLQELYYALESDLSPENLCMDGEASPAYVMQRSTFLHAALDALKAMGIPKPKGVYL